MLKKESVNDEYICDDRPLPPCPEVDNMTDEELEEAFNRLFKQGKKQENNKE